MMCAQVQESDSGRGHSTISGKSKILRSQSGKMSLLRSAVRSHQAGG